MVTGRVPHEVAFCVCAEQRRRHEIGAILRRIEVLISGRIQHVRRNDCSWIAAGYIENKASLPVFQDPRHPSEPFDRSSLPGPIGSSNVPFVRRSCRTS